MIHRFKQNDLPIVLDVNSGAIHIVDDLVYDLLGFYPDPGKEIFGLPYPEEEIRDAMTEIDQLIADGQLFSQDAYSSSIHFQERKPVLKAMCLHIAHDCNLRCGYCFASQGDFQGTRSLMPLEVGQKALRYLVDNSGNRRNLEVDFFGGEPLMNFDVVRQLVEYGRSLETEYDKHFRFTLTTNGVLLDDEIIAFCNTHMDNVVLSLDGRKDVNDRMRPTVNGKGSYDLIVPRFQELVRERGNKSYFIRGTFTKLNMKFAEDVKHYVELGFKSTSMEPVVSEPGLPYTLEETDLPVIFSQYDQLAEDLIDKHGTPEAFEFFHFNIDLTQGPCLIKRVSGCGAGSEYTAVTPEGDLYPCHQFVGNTDFRMGSVLDGTYDTTMGTRFRNAHVYNKPACRECWARFYCSGGCHANAYNFNNDISIPYALGCEMERKRLELAIYIQARLLMEAE